MAGLRRAVRLHSDPFVAVDIFVKNNWANVFGYQALKVNKKSKRFSIGVKSSWSFANLIRHHGNAVFLDSSWRNKNENRAPLTFVATTNAAGHMVPCACAAYLSADATTSSFEHLLASLEEEVLKEAEKICEESINDPNLDPDDILYVNAAKIQEQGTWHPAVVMIDKCRAELNALQSVWPETQVRLCQFHILQAICRWDTDAKAGSQKPPGINRKDKPGICAAFREAQRCGNMDDWPAARVTFDAAIKA
ncbi:hypothetical protein A4X13_0g8360 [Tilletia indica]|uniref:MULE transposase domain-containing protein n=1 Tax=Tilletia indica TaxID=43049 RepID=A0A177TB64_9BASI|nr:hypothetical protein A4X13_0g8360 [Tilletia indica]